ncbi:MAG TPA: hypothetical protein VM512_11220 [Burkholderiaceae bacterium]|nr:hypothetical protein [Burkholderiaceae bacterium]
MFEAVAMSYGLSDGEWRPWGNAFGSQWCSDRDLDPREGHCLRTTKERLLVDANAQI